MGRPSPAAAVRFGLSILEGRARGAEFAVLLLLAPAIAAWIFSREISSIFLLTPVLVLAGLRLPPLPAGLVAAATAVTGLMMTAFGHGPFHSLAPLDRGLMLQAFVAVTIILTMPVSFLNRERLRTARALRRSEEHYRLLADHGSDLVLRLSAAGEADYVSSASTRLLGLSPGGLAGTALEGRIHQEDRCRYTSALERVRRTGEAVTCFRMRNARGSDRWVEAYMRLASPAGSIAPRRGDHHSCAAFAEGRCHPGEGAPCVHGSGQPSAEAAGEPWPIIASLRDIHARRSAELLAADSAARLREANRLLLMAEELASLGHWTYDAARCEIVLSAEAATMIGAAQLTLPAEEALAMIGPADRRLLLRALIAARRGELPVECTVRLDTGGEARTLQLRIQQTGENGWDGLFGVVSDISERLRADRRLVTAVKEARAAAAFRSQFLATMSHEIRTPMTGVIGMIELLEDDPLPTERALYLHTLRHSADLLMAVLNDILDFSKVDGGHIAIASEPFDLGQTLLTTLRLFDRAASGKGLTLRLDAPEPGSLWLRGDAVRVRQVLSNLLSNAIKFTDEGEIVLSCEVQSRAGGRHALRLTVADRGVGIGPELRARLFEPFVQGDDSGAGAGTGLGLAISRRLVAAMGGTISLRSAPGQGSAFTVNLTLAGAPGAAALPRPVPRASQRPLDILLAEDNPVNQLLITAYCKRLGHRITCAADGEAAMAAADGRAFDVILMDMQMPRCDGLTAAHRIRTGGGPSAAVPIIALTADATAAARPLYAEAGFTRLLTKPIGSAALASALADLGQGQSGASAAIPGRSDREALDPATLGEVRDMLGAARLDALLDLLAAELEQRPRALREALADQDFERAAAEAHSLKGAAANLGATAVTAAAAELEPAIASAAAGDPRAVAPALRRLAAAVSDAQHALAALPRAGRALAVGA